MKYAFPLETKHLFLLSQKTVVRNRRFGIGNKLSALSHLNLFAPYAQGSTCIPQPACSRGASA